MSKERTVLLRTASFSVEAGEAAVGARPATVASDCDEGASSRRPGFMLHAGLDLSRKKIDVCLLSAAGLAVA
jgi:hypothetical protein